MPEQTPYTPGMRDVIKNAKVEAARMGHSYLGPEHFLLGILRKGEGLAWQILETLGVQAERIRLELEGTLMLEKRLTTTLLAPTPKASQVLEKAKEIAGRMQDDWVRTEHLLLGLIEVEDTPTADCLRRFGIDFETAERAVHKALATNPHPKRKVGVQESESDKAEPEAVGAGPDREVAERVMRELLDAPSPAGGAKIAFTPQVYDVLKCAKAEASRLGHDYTGPEHYLLGILRKGSGLAIQILQQLGANLETLEKELLSAITPAAAPFSGAVASTQEAKELLTLARAIARELKTNWVGTEHLLLALILAPGTIASACLNRLKIEYEAAKREIVNLLNSEKESASA